MRFAIVYRPKNPPPPDQLPGMLQAMAEWMQRYANRVEGVQFFVGGGGYGTIETDDSEELARLIAEHPFTQYSEIEVRPLIDPQAALGILQSAYPAG
jgi:muconolactone delta-isomerase